MIISVQSQFTVAGISAQIFREFLNNEVVKKTKFLFLNIKPHGLQRTFGIQKRI